MAFVNNAETTSDVPFSFFYLLATTMDWTQKDMKRLLRELKQQIVFFDVWGMKSIQYLIGNLVSVAYFGFPEGYNNGRNLIETDLMEPPLGFPDSVITLYKHEARFLVHLGKVEFGSGIKKSCMARGIQRWLCYSVHMEAKPFYRKINLKSCYLVLS